MKIAYFHYLYDVKDSSVGAAVHVSELAAAIRTYGHQVRIFTPRRTKENGSARPRKGRKSTCRRLMSQVRTLISNVPLFTGEWRKLRTFQPDAVLIRYNYLNFSSTLAARILGIPVILEVNAPMVYEKREYTRGNLPCIPGLVERLNIHLARRVFVVSSQLKRYFVDRSIPEDKITVIPNGVDTSRFHPNVDGQAMRVRLGLSDKLVLGFAGSFHYWHGIGNLVHFILTVLDRFDHSAFLLVGRGPLKDDLEQRLSAFIAAGRVVMTGYVDHKEMPRVLAVMDIALAPYPNLPYFYYSPLKLFEYMASGKAIIASRVGQVEEIITHEKHGLLVDPDDPEEMVRAAHRLIRDSGKRCQLGRQARGLVKRRYSWRKTAGEVIGLMKSVISIRERDEGTAL